MGRCPGDRRQTVPRAEPPGPKVKLSEDPSAAVTGTGPFTALPFVRLFSRASRLARRRPRAAGEATPPLLFLGA
jgi:hypothetical protein